MSKFTRLWKTGVTDGIYTILTTIHPILRAVASKAESFNS